LTGCPDYKASFSLRWNKLERLSLIGVVKLLQEINEPGGNVLQEQFTAVPTFQRVKITAVNYQRILNLILKTNVIKQYCSNLLPFHSN
jgi:hypothetical protein